MIQIGQVLERIRRVVGTEGEKCLMACVLPMKKLTIKIHGWIASDSIPRPAEEPFLDSQLSPSALLQVILRPCGSCERMQKSVCNSLDESVVSDLLFGARNLVNSPRFCYCGYCQFSALLLSNRPSSCILISETQGPCVGSTHHVEFCAYVLRKVRGHSKAVVHLKAPMPSPAVARLE
jgi:hypothetical protein